MFNPNKALAKKNEKAMKKKAIADLKAMSEALIPATLKTGLIVDVNEVVCGDPSCAPVDTIFTFLWENSGKGVFAIPLEAHEITQDELTDFFPDDETLQAWKEGKRARWPPLPKLRFDIGERVECRVGPHPVKGWAPGRIIKLHYSEPSWPPNMIAPYQISLHDGRLIFAPQDNDQVIRLRPPAAPNAPPSPEYVPRATDDDDDNNDDEDNFDGEDDDGEQYGEDGNDEDNGEDGYLNEEEKPSSSSSS